jgi:DedD protein
MIDANDLHQTAAAPSTDLDRLRRQARQRFIGAAVLVLVAVIALPFFLDAKPRPVSPNVTIEIAGAASSTPLAASATSATPAAPSQPTPTAETPPPTTVPIAVPAAAAPAAASSGYTVQAGSFAERAKANEVTVKLTKAGVTYYTQDALARDGSPRIRVRLGPFETKQEAERISARINQLGIKTIILNPR